MKNISIIKIKTISFIIVAIFFFVITIMLFIDNNKIPNSSVNYTSKNNSSQATRENLTNPSNMYEVTAVSGEIAVFKNGESFSVLLEPVKIKNLPESDRILIENGVCFDNYKDLIEFLENYE